MFSSVERGFSLLPRLGREVHLCFFENERTDVCISPLSRREEYVSLRFGERERCASLRDERVSLFSGES